MPIAPRSRISSKPDTLGDPGAVFFEVLREPVVRDVHEETIRPLDTGLNEPVCRISGAEPGAVRAVEVDADVRVHLQRVHRVVEHREALVGSSRLVRLGRLAPLVVPCLGVEAAELLVPRDDAQTVGLQNDHRLFVTDSRRKAIDPGHIFLDSGGPTGRELSTVAERYVVCDQDGDGSLAGGALDRVLNILLDALGGTFREPDRLRCIDHLTDEISISFITAGDEIGNLFSCAVVRLGDVELGIRVVCQSKPWPRGNYHNQNGANNEEVSQLSLICQFPFLSFLR